MNNKLITYKKSGVNINAADKFVNFISSVSSKKKGKKKYSHIRYEIYKFICSLYVETTFFICK